MNTFAEVIEQLREQMRKLTVAQAALLDLEEPITKPAAGDAKILGYFGDHADPLTKMKRGKRRHLSPEARAKMRAAQQRRWAKWRKENRRG